MTIGAILHGRTGAVISARPGDSVRAVIDLLAQNRIGAVPVVEGDSIVGIFSERDLVRLMSSYGPEALDRTLDEVMTKSPIQRVQHFLHANPTAVPAIVLGRLAVDRPAHGLGLGGDLLMDAVRRVVSISEQAGVRTILVHALHEQAQRFYEHHGFERSPLVLMLRLGARS